MTLASTQSKTASPTTKQPPAQTTPQAKSGAARRPVDKFGDRRDELADAALLTLSELGYARTSLREIAQNSDFSHGVLHYYFQDKVDLITHCVRRYKAYCVTRYDEIVASATTAEELEVGFAQALARSMVDDGTMHRLWYDLRSQSMFEDSFREDVVAIDRALESMIWRVVDRYAELGSATPRVDSSAAYPLFDGLFQQALLGYLAGDGAQVTRLEQEARSLLRLLVPLPA